MKFLNTRGSASAMAPSSPKSLHRISSHSRLYISRSKTHIITVYNFVVIIIRTLISLQLTSILSVTCLVVVLWPELWLQWRSKNCGRDCSGSYACRLTPFHKLNVKAWWGLGFHTLSKQCYHSSAYLKMIDYLQLRQDALSIRARVTTQHVTSMYRMNSYIQRYWYYTSRGLGRVRCLVVHSSNQWCSHTRAWVVQHRACAIQPTVMCIYATQLA